MKVAIVHYWLVGMRGGEKVLEVLCRLYPQADIFTHVYDPAAVSDGLKAHRIQTTFINRLFRAPRSYKNYLPLMPIALEELDLRGYDLIISSESGPAKGIIPPPDAVHICYCHSPMRYIWNMYPEYKKDAGALKRFIMPILTHYLRSWDVSSSARVDYFVANSGVVARRVEKYYRRHADVIYPPVDVRAFQALPAHEISDFYLLAGELVSYKRPDLAVKAFNLSGRKLVVIGGGEMLPELRRLAGPNVQVLGPQPFSELKSHYSRCKALIFPGEEDFGMVPVECMASGRPVVAYGKGGATETVVDGETGVFFHEQTSEALNAAIVRLDGLGLKSEAIVAHAETFSTAKFEAAFSSFVETCLARNAVNPKRA
jgi:glycosyltransferase involved in cell wall biosynthesis